MDPSQAAIIGSYSDQKTLILSEQDEADTVLLLPSSSGAMHVQQNTILDGLTLKELHERQNELGNLSLHSPEIRLQTL